MKKLVTILSSMILILAVFWTPSHACDKPDCSHTNINNIVAKGGEGGAGGHGGAGGTGIGVGGTVFNSNNPTNINAPTNVGIVSPTNINTPVNNNSFNPNNANINNPSNTVNVTNNPNNTLNQSQTQGNVQQMNVEAPTIPAGLGRSLPDPVQPQYGPVTTYIGPFNKGWNILENLSILLQHDQTSEKKCNYTMVEAENLYQEAVKFETRVIRKLSYEFDTCRLYLKFPEKYKIIGFVFLGEGRFWSRPTTIDAVAKGMIETMRSGANAMVVMKNGADFSVSSWGAGIGLAYTHGGLKGSEKDWYDSGSGGTGFAFSSVKPKSTPLLVGVMIQDDQGVRGLEKSGK